MRWMPYVIIAGLLTVTFPGAVPGALGQDCSLAVRALGREEADQVAVDVRSGGPPGGVDTPGDACGLAPQEIDADGDGHAVLEDNCPGTANGDQHDADDDGLGDACDPIHHEEDPDGDGHEAPEDNCPGTANGDQHDADDDGLGDSCEGDDDGDQTPDEAEPAVCGNLENPNFDEDGRCEDDDYQPPVSA